MCIRLYVMLNLRRGSIWYIFTNQIISWKNTVWRHSTVNITEKFSDTGTDKNMPALLEFIEQDKPFESENKQTDSQLHFEKFMPISFCPHQNYQTSVRTNQKTKLWSYRPTDQCQKRRKGFFRLGWQIFKHLKCVFLSPISDDEVQDGTTFLFFR